MEDKICNMCEESQPIESFAFLNKKLGIRKYRCKGCDKLVRKEHYEKNKEDVKHKCRVQNHKSKTTNAQYAWDYLKEHPCVDCGNDNPVVLEFDHRDPEDKFKNVCVMVHDGYTLEKVKVEIGKCDVRCANCHRIKTAKQFNHYNYLVL